LATVTAFTADTIALAFRRFIFPSLSRKDLSSLQVILGGGGALNPVLRNCLQARLGVGRLWTHEDFGVPNEAKEALAFALLGYQTLCGRPSNVPSATGASRPAVLGKITPGHRVSTRAFLL
jgi:anhydro-N-acetylmuramic acid kinase